jgi:isopentenyldiphosphate isomerase/mRNA-degrading endonuclease RelE of RelBE toxin-antitoxin system
MIYKVKLTPIAEKDFSKLDKSIQEQISKKIKKLKENPNLGKNLTSFLKNRKLLKVNKYRVLFFIENNDIVIIRIEQKKNIYTINENILKSPTEQILAEKIIIVNKIDEIVGQKEKYRLSKEDTFRTSCLVIKNNNNEILLAKRALSKKDKPGKWGFSVAGTNQANEDYVDCILRETEEELGILIADFELQLIEKIFIKEKSYQMFSCIYLVTVEDSEKFNINKQEVEKIEWYSKQKLEKELKENKDEYLDYIPKYLLKYYDIK